MPNALGLILGGMAEGAGQAGQRYFENQYKTDSEKKLYEERSKLDEARALRLADYQNTQQTARDTRQNEFTLGRDAQQNEFTAGQNAEQRGHGIVLSNMQNEAADGRLDKQLAGQDRTQSRADARADARNQTLLDREDIRAQRAEEKDANRIQSIQTDPKTGALYAVKGNGKTETLMDENGQPRGGMRGLSDVAQQELKMLGEEMKSPMVTPDRMDAIRNRTNEILYPSKNGKQSGMPSPSDTDLSYMRANAGNPKMREKFIGKFGQEAYDSAFPSKPESGNKSAPSNSGPSPSKRGIVGANMPEQTVPDDAGTTGLPSDSYNGVPRTVTTPAGMQGRYATPAKTTDNPEYRNKIVNDIVAKAQSGDQRAQEFMRRAGGMSGVGDNIEEALSILQGK